MKETAKITDFEEIKIKLPDYWNDFDPKSIIKFILKINNDYINKNENYIIELTNKDIAEMEYTNWIDCFQQDLIVDTLGIYIKPLSHMVFRGILEKSGIVGFPLKLFISNNCDLVLQFHLDEYVKHFSPQLDKDTFDYGYKNTLFEHFIYRGFHKGRIPNNLIDQYLVTKH